MAAPKIQITRSHIVLLLNFLLGVLGGNALPPLPLIGDMLGTPSASPSLPQCPPPDVTPAKGSVPTP